MNRVEQSVSSHRCASASLHATGHHPFPSPVEDTNNSKCLVSNTVGSSIHTATAPKTVAWSDSLMVRLPSLSQAKKEQMPEELLANEQHSHITLNPQGETYLPSHETNTYSWTRLSRRTRITRKTNWTLQREKKDILKSEIQHLENCRALAPVTPTTTWGVALGSETPAPYPQAVPDHIPSLCLH